MTWTAPVVERNRVAPDDERAMLDARLDHLRTMFLSKLGGLTDAQLKLRSVPPSNLSLLGLLRHLAEVERWWFRMNFLGGGLREIWCAEDERADFDFPADADAEADYAAYVIELEMVRNLIAGHGLEETFHRPGSDVLLTLRWLYTHMIEEYARHAGHADLLREAIDGQVTD